MARDVTIIEKHKFTSDQLGRESIIDNLTVMIENTHEPLTMSVNGAWGSGKTTFVKLWQRHLGSKNIRSIYFSAWEDDFSKEPLISILGEIKKYIDDNFSNPSEQSKSFEKVKTFGGKILKRGVPAFLKGITAGIVDIDKGFEDAIGVMTESAAQELIENYSKEKDVAQDFKKSIQELLSKIDGSKPFVIFIDELDRCRPLYAIELLERIKHIFGIDGLIFILSVDTKQLSESIKSQYGNIDTDNYLRRFIDLEYNLPAPNIEAFSRYLYEEFYGFSKYFKSKEIDKNDVLNDLEILKYYVKVFSLTLREIEHIFFQINIAYKTLSKEKGELHFMAFMFLIALKIKYPNFYVALIEKKLTIDEKLRFMENFSYVTKDQQTSWLYGKAMLFSAMLDYQEMETLRKQEENSEPYELKHRFVEICFSTSFDPVGYKVNRATNEVIEKINFISRFNIH